MPSVTTGGFPATTNTQDQLFCPEVWASYTALQTMAGVWQAVWQHRPCLGTTSPLALGVSGIVGAGFHASLAPNPAARPGLGA